MGCLGNGDTNDVSKPTKIEVDNQKLLHISMGKRHAVAITESGNVYSWGKGIVKKKKIFSYNLIGEW